MAGRKTVQKNKSEDLAAAAVNGDQPEGLPQDEEFSGVALQVIRDDQGNIKVVTNPLNVDPLAVQTIIEVGLAEWRQRLGFDQNK